ncbi:MAG: serine/threonine protein kinase, partial [Zavarzinella sp.]|nr:serine/threonine protein kinase [Zavarzinella sp.]
QAVAYAHSRGILHRDLKPQNVILGPFGEVQVLDWGLAKLVGQADDGADASGVSVTAHAAAGETMPGAVVGTPGYLSPEQAAGSADARSDVYGLGAILFEILTGQPPHRGTSLAEVLKATRLPVAPRALVIDPTVPRALDAVSAKALAPDPVDRYASAAELAEDVQRFLADEPVSAWREPMTVRARRWIGRHRALVGTTSAAATAIAIILAVATVLLRSAYARESAARAQADRHAEEARAERDRATANFQLARRAVNQYLDRVTESQELKARGLERLRRDLLRTAVDFQQELIRQHGDDPGIRAERGRAFWQLGTITRDLGNPAEAIALLHSAREIQEGLAREQPSEAVHREDLARTWNQLGNVAADAGRLTEAEEFYDRALAARRELIASQPDRTDLRSELAGTHNNLANLYRLTGRWDRAEISYAAAVDAYAPLVEAAPNEVKYRHGLAQTLNNLGALQADTARPELALKTHDRAAGHWAALVRLGPDVPDYSLGQAGGHLNRGLALQAAGRTAEAESANRAAITQLEALADGHPRVGDYRLALAKAWGNLGVVLAGTRRADAKDSRQKALGILKRLTDENPGVLEYRRALAGAHGNLGTLLADDPAERKAAKDALDQSLAMREELAKAHADVPEVRAELADALNNLGSAEVIAPAAALGFAKRSLEVRHGLAARFSNVPEYAAAEARAQTNIGALCVALGQADQAWRAFDAARDTWARLTAEFPAVVEYRHDFAAHHLNRGILAQATGRPDVAEAEYGAARQLWADLSRERPEAPRYREQLARVASLLAPIHREKGRDPAHLDAAEASYREAISAWEDLTKAHPDVARYAIALGGAYYGLGSLTGLNRFKPADALPWYDKAVAVLRPVADRDGADSPAGRQLHMALFGRAVAFGLLKRHEESLHAWDDALEAATGASRTNTATARRNSLAAYADHLASVARGGNPGEAIERAKVFDREKDLPGPAALAVARLYAIAAATAPKETAQRYINRGAEWLDAARKAGAFTDPAARKRLTEDRDLEPLRRTEAYRRAVGMVRKPD